MTDYVETIKYIESIPWTMRKPGLHRMRELMERLGNPHDRLRFIHIAGTNGKGSTSAMLAAVTEAAGYRTGLFTSPHLLKYNERMKINGIDIDDEALTEVISKVADAAAGMEEEPSEFEILTAAGFLWFEKESCDVVILEVGLGGELDSTNVIKTKELAVITPIGYDHTAILGDKIEDIAGAKAGIIIPGCDVIMALQNGKESDAGKVEKVIRENCEVKNAFLHIPDEDGIEELSSDIHGIVFRSSYLKETVRLNLTGDYQLMNALTVIECIKVLNEKEKLFLTEEAVLKGLDKVKWAARFEVLNEDPVFILDGAHNEHGIRAAVNSLKKLFGDEKIIYILGILGDKDIDGMLSLLYTNAKSFITLTPESSRALEGEKLADRLRSDGFEAVSFKKPKEAVSYAFDLCSNVEGACICSLGSLYLAGEVRKVFVNR